MKRFLKLTVVLALGISAFSPLLVVSKASAASCHYTSQDKAKGYKC